MNSDERDAWLAAELEWFRGEVQRMQAIEPGLHPWREGGNGLDDGRVRRLIEEAMKDADIDELQALLAALEHGAERHNRIRRN